MGYTNHQIATALQHTSRPEFVFGLKPKAVYKRLAKKLHPDAGGSDAAFQALQTLWEDYERLEAAGEYGNTNPVNVQGEIEQSPVLLGRGDIALVWSGQRGAQPVAVKVAEDALDNDLIQYEMKVISYLNAMTRDVAMEGFYPRLEWNGNWDGTHMANVLSYDPLVTPETLISLEYLGEYFEHQLDPRHVAWIWRRLVSALAWAHKCGIIHANVTPASILIHPQHHAVILIDWIHASRDQQPVRSMSNTWAALYPSEIVAGGAPLPGTDVYMAAKTMQWVCKKMPNEMLAYFDWCASDHQLARPDRFDSLIEAFDRVIYERLGWKREFVALDVLDVTTL